MDVYQLQAIASKNSHIQKAIRDYYRAFEQRSRWLKEELEEYENKLVDEWERYKDHLEDETTEGARDYPVPSCVNEGQWCAQFLDRLTQLPHETLHFA